VPIRYLKHPAIVHSQVEPEPNTSSGGRNKLRQERRIAGDTIAFISTNITAYTAYTTYRDTNVPRIAATGANAGAWRETTTGGGVVPLWMT